MPTPNTTPDPHPQTSQPVLASTLITPFAIDTLVDNICARTTARPRNTNPSSSRRLTAPTNATLQAGCNPVDDALGHGVQKGRMVVITNAENANQLSRALLVDFLLTSKSGGPAGEADAPEVAVVDTTGNFDIYRLYTGVVARLEADADLARVWSGKGGGSRRAEDVGAELLERVKIMRVFDFTGVEEAVGEIEGRWEGRSGEGVTVGSERGREREAVAEAGQEDFVPDSQGEEEDEILFEEEVTGRSVVRESPPGVLVRNPAERPSIAEEKSDMEARTGFIFIYHLAHVMNPLLKKDHTHASHQLSTFLKSLSTLTRKHSLYTLLINPTTPSTLSRQKHYQQQQHSNLPPSTPPSTSIFASSKSEPALWPHLAPYADLHLMVTRMPRRRGDARILYADGGLMGHVELGESRKGAEVVEVVEVVSDRWGGREGDWGCFPSSK